MRWLLFCSALAFRCGVPILRVYRCYNCLSRLGALALLDGVQNYAPLMPRVDGATSAELAAASRALVWTKRCRSCGEQKLEDEQRCHVHKFACITEQNSIRIVSKWHAKTRFLWAVDKPRAARMYSPLVVARMKGVLPRATQSLCRRHPRRGQRHSALRSAPRRGRSTRALPFEPFKAVLIARRHRCAANDKGLRLPLGVLCKPTMRRARAARRR